MTPEDPDGEPPAGGSSPEAVVAAGRRAGKALRAIAADLYGRERVDADWRADGRTRAKLRRLVLRRATRPGGR